ncbi:MAG TPA: carbonic anhydrase [Rhizomicrobium sp.]|nr:carbonic anhydrase [Rhizomicrobium sp.]
MCLGPHVPPHLLSRRKFGFLAGASLLVPFAARAAEVDALALTCIDYRLVEAGVRFVNGLGLTKDFDQVALAGASLAAVSDKFPSSNKAFWDHVDIARSLHHVKRLIVVDHRDCGAYKVAFGPDFAPKPPEEDAQHKTVMEKLKAQLATKHPELTSEYYLLALDGTAKRLL